MVTREDLGGIRSSIISSASGRWETETVSSGPGLVENETSEMSQTAVDEILPTSGGTSEEAVPATAELAQDPPETDSRVQPSEALQTTSSSVSTSESSELNEPRYPRRDRRPRQHYEPGT